MGHIFQLGTKYAEALGLKVLDANGKLATVTMGSYGIGISRAVAMVAETTCDDRGLAWPRNLAPFDVIVIATGKEKALAVEAERIALELSGSGLDVLLDDRKASPGVKFTDAEVLGIPTAVVVGRGLANGVVEVRDRTAGTKDEVGGRRRGRAGHRGRARRVILGLPLATMALLVVAAFAAGWVDSVVGGGGLIQLPSLLIGLPPDTAVATVSGTNKLSSAAGTAVATGTYLSKVRSSGRSRCRSWRRRTRARPPGPSSYGSSRERCSRRSCSSP
jgi:hypothetical protein